MSFIMNDYSCNKNITKSQNHKNSYCIIVSIIIYQIYSITLPLCSKLKPIDFSVKKVQTKSIIWWLQKLYRSGHLVLFLGTPRGYIYIFFWNKLRGDFTLKKHSYHYYIKKPTELHSYHYCNWAWCQGGCWACPVKVII